MIKKTIIAISLMASMPSMANYCDFKRIDGIEFELGKTSQYQKFENSQSGIDADAFELIFAHKIHEDKYGNQFWVDEPLSYEDAYGRNLKITNQNEFKYDYVVSDTDPRVKLKVRKYEALLDNCKKVTIKVPESRDRFAKYFNVMNEAIDGKFSFTAEQSDLGLIYLPDLKKVEAHVGKSIYFLNSQVNDFYGVTNDHKNQKVVIDTLKDYRIKSISYDYVSIPGGKVNEYRDGQFGIIIEIDGKEVKVPFIRERFAYSNPLSWKNIRDKYKENIKRSEVVYGMNMHETVLSLGMPDYIRYFEVIKSKETGAEYERNDYFPYDGKRLNHPLGESYNAGVRQAWFYRDAEGSLRHIVFSRDNELTEILQPYETVDYARENGFILNVGR